MAATHATALGAAGYTLIAPETEIIAAARVDRPWLPGMEAQASTRHARIRDLHV